MLPASGELPTHKDLTLGTPEGPQLARCTNFLGLQEQNVTSYAASTTHMYCLMGLEVQGQGVGLACPLDNLFLALSSPLSYLCPAFPL